VRLFCRSSVMLTKTLTGNRPLLIDERRVAFDEARLLESPHAPQAGGFRQTDALRQLTIG